MASTKNKNTVNDYLVEVEENNRLFEHVNYIHNSNGLAVDPRCLLLARSSAEWVGIV